jgi:transmembrane sensor
MTDQDHPHNARSDADWDAIARFVAGEGASSQRAEMQRMLDGDPARAALITALDSSLQIAEPAPLTAIEVESALAAVLARRAGDAPTRTVSRGATVIPFDLYRSRWRDARLRAAAAVLVVAGVGLLWKMAGTSGSSGGAAAEQAHFASAVGALDSLRLPDGSRVLLGPGSELTLASDFGKGARELTLRGEARFDVVHDDTHSFVVHTSSATFRDLGTVFSIHSDAGDGARIAVSSGSVAVQSASAGSAEVTLKAGDRATVAMAGAVRVERAAVTSEDLAWTSGQLVFRDAPVQQVAADLRRWYGVELTVDSALAKRTLTATFERGSVADVGPTLAAALGGAFRQDGNTLHVISIAAVVPQK